MPFSRWRKGTKIIFLPAHFSYFLPLYVIFSAIITTTLLGCTTATSLSTDNDWYNDNGTWHVVHKI